MQILNEWCLQNGINVNIKKSGAISREEIYYVDKIISNYTIYIYLGIYMGLSGIDISKYIEILTEKTENIIKKRNQICYFLSQKEKC